MKKCLFVVLLIIMASLAYATQIDEWFEESQTETVSWGSSITADARNLSTSLTVGGELSRTVSATLTCAAGYSGFGASLTLRLDLALQKRIGLGAK